jgi:hypothetical protein
MQIFFFTTPHVQCEPIFFFTTPHVQCEPILFRAHMMLIVLVILLSSDLFVKNNYYALLYSRLAVKFIVRYT